MENLDFLKCYYRPSFFRMKIDVPVDLSNLLEITDEVFALYLHEYIHFIQDVSTVYGLMNISTITYYIHDVASRLVKQEEKSFQVPVSLIDDGRDFGYKNFNLRPYYFGSPINPKRSKVKLVNYERVTFQWGKSEFDLLDKVNITISDERTGELEEYQFGGNHVCEGMAYLCERYVYPEIDPPTDDYPYMIAQKLAEKIYPEFAEDPLLIIAACDASLMTYHPGLSFVRLLEYFRDTSFLERAENIKQIHEEASTLLKGTHHDFNEILETVRGQVKLNFKSEHFEGNNKWVDAVFDKIKDFRNRVPEFVTDIIRFRDLKRNEIFGAFHRLVGSPLVLNSDDEGNISLPLGFDGQNFNPPLFWAINQMLRVFHNQKSLPCEMKQFCIKSEKEDGKIITDERCDNNPWSRCFDKDLCPFATMWQHWALSDYYPVQVK
jgi:hypothetical protein